MAEAPVVSYAPTEELTLIRDTARQFLEERIPLEKVRDLMMSEQGFDDALWKEMASMGWPGLAIAEEYGGAGLGHVEMATLLEEMGRLVTPGPFFASAVAAANVIDAVATDDQRATWLPGIASGETIATLAHFEQARRWSSTNPEARATRSESGWVIDGEKRSVLAGESADLLLVTAATDDGVGVFAVDPNLNGVSITAEPVLDLTRRQARVTLEDVEVADDARLGTGDVSEGLERALNVVVSLLAAEQVGGAQRCMEMSVEYAKTRHQFGRPIGSFQAIKHRCANMLVKVEHAKSAAYHAVRVTDDVVELAIAAPMAASLASEAFVWVAGETIQVHGGIGFTWEHDAHIYLKRAKASSLLFGDPAHHRDRLGQALGI